MQHFDAVQSGRIVGGAVWLGIAAVLLVIGVVRLVALIRSRRPGEPTRWRSIAIVVALLAVGLALLQAELVTLLA